MSPSFQEVGSWMLDNYDSIGFTSVNELSKIIGVSNASLVRYTQALGFSGYKQFKETVQEELRTKLKPDSNVVLNELDVLPIKKKLQKLADNEIQNLSKTLKGLSVQSLSRMVQGVLQSERIFVSGFGVSKNIMQIFEYALVSMQIKEVHSITGSISDYSARLASMNSADCLFIMTMPPYSPEALQVGNAAHARKVKVYLFTDSAACPIYPIADSVACSANNSLLLTNSFVGMVAVIQVFINMLLLGSDENLISHMKAVVATEREGYAWLKSQKEVLR
jgi:DNA-binding MurR/RpiR family transcriptional regulator